MKNVTITTWFMKRSDKKCFGVQADFKRSEEKVSAIMWLIKRGDQKYPTGSPTLT
jgi:hypothetical protein